MTRWMAAGDSLDALLERGGFARQRDGGATGGDNFDEGRGGLADDMARLFRLPGTGCTLEAI